MPINKWNDTDAAGLSQLDLLAYRSRLLASDRSVINIFGGNTSVKALETDHTGRRMSVLWVKGSGSDLANCTGKDFAGLKLDEVLPLLDRAEMSDEEMVAYLSRCLFEPNRPRQSIETLLHAFTPGTHVDHTHPDAIIALACAARGEAAARDVFGDSMVWVDYIRPGFTLSKQIGELLRENPQATCVVMGKHGLITWGEDAKSSYASAIAHIQRAEDALNEAEKRAFGFLSSEGLPAESDMKSEDRAKIVSQVMPTLRGAVSSQRKAVVTFDDSDEVLAFVNSPMAKELSQIGAACPDHLVHTKRVPLFIEWDGQDVTALKQLLKDGVTTYQHELRRLLHDVQQRRKYEDGRFVAAGDSGAGVGHVQYRTRCNSGRRVATALLPCHSGDGFVFAGGHIYIAECRGIIQHRVLAVGAVQTKPAASRSGIGRARGIRYGRGQRDRARHRTQAGAGRRACRHRRYQSRWRKTGSRRYLQSEWLKARCGCELQCNQ